MHWTDFFYFTLGAAGIFFLSGIFQELSDIKHRLRRMHHAYRSDSERRGNSDLHRPQEDAGVAKGRTGRSGW
jgi:hypothetical protein